MQEPIWKLDATLDQLKTSKSVCDILEGQILDGAFDELNTAEFNNLICKPPHLMNIIREDRLEMFRKFREYKKVK